MDPNWPFFLCFFSVILLVFGSGCAGFGNWPEVGTCHTREETYTMVFAKIKFLLNAKWLGMNELLILRQIINDILRSRIIFKFPRR